MTAVDELKKARGEDYGGKDSAPKDPDESVSTTRIIKLSDDEMKAFAGAKPGQELACDVRGNLEEDGHFHVMSVSPPQGAQSYSENQMAGQVAQMVRPQLMPSPSG